MNLDQIVIVNNDPMGNNEKYSMLVDGYDEPSHPCNIDFLTKYFGINKNERVIIIKISNSGQHKFEAIYHADDYAFYKTENGQNLYRKAETGVFIDGESVDSKQETLDFLDEVFYISSEDVFSFKFDLYAI